MSASNFANCPKCQAEHFKKIEQLETEIIKQYGKIDARDWMEKLSAMKKEKNQDETTTLREDYEFYTKDGILEIIYGCTCEICGGYFKFNKKINLLEEGDF